MEELLKEKIEQLKTAMNLIVSRENKMVQLKAKSKN
jgi:hypothetical protein